ncbi:uncharacterized protein LOC106780252 [Vigna radiata var. radiata]|uniref:Uncharacterized protein LOC106780252 n=1 Tax=Vigna radiata var. radiata TaxID=3916 RepID=A0A1S3W161_VIGRR|nr:uncharacterized protein LOC106780252 [Vigna radiata var. radiata]
MVVVQIPTPIGADENKYCRYHQNRGHTTEDCVTLKDKLETLVQAGHLQRFVQRRGSSSRTRRPPVQQDPLKRRSQQRTDRSRSRSADRTVRGVINTILGGFAGGGSTSAARKRHIRNLHNVSRTGALKRSMPTITFYDEDFHAPDLEQDDPMVITTMIARYQVGKVLVDQGSSANRSSSSEEMFQDVGHKVFLFSLHINNNGAGDSGATTTKVLMVVATTKWQ